LRQKATVFLAQAGAENKEQSLLNVMAIIAYVKTRLFAPFLYSTFIILPRQARDKHRERKSQKREMMRVFFLTAA
jgi:hypothetical protein